MTAHLNKTISLLLLLLFSGLLPAWDIEKANREIDMWKVRDARKGNHVIHITTRIKCNAEKAYRLFTNEQYLTWLAPEANVEPMVGGKYEFFFSPEEKTTDCTLGCRITAAEPGRFIAFDWAGPSRYEELMNRADPLTHVVVLFEQCDRKLMKCTDVHLIHSGWGNTDEWNQAREWFERRWKSAFEELQTQAELIE